MINNGLFLVFIGFIIYEAVYAYPPSRRNASRLGSKYKHPKNGRRSIYYGDYTNKTENKSDSPKENPLERVLLAIDTGMKNFMPSKNKQQVVDNIAKSLVDFARKTASNPVYRTKAKEYDIKPELIRFTDDKPSLLLELNTESIINGLKDLLRSKTVQQLMDHFTKEAAVVYRSIQNELDKDENKKDVKQ